MKKIIGSIIVLVGVLFLLSNYNLISLDNMWSYIWPFSIIVIGISGMVTNKKGDFVYATMILIGFLYLLRAFNIINQNFIDMTLWPIIVIIIGLSFFINFTKPKKINGEFRKFVAVFSGIDEKIEDNLYIGSDLTAVFGGIEIDLRNVKFKEKQAYINVVVAFGGVDLIVPKNTKVITNGTPILGGIDNKVTSDKEANEIIINYTLLCGGIEIKN